MFTGSKHCCNQHRATIILFFHEYGIKKNWKTIALVRVETLGPFVNTLAADDKYSRRNVQNFQQQLPRALSQTQKIFPAIFNSFHKSTSNLESFF